MRLVLIDIKDLNSPTTNIKSLTVYYNSKLDVILTFLNLDTNNTHKEYINNISDLESYQGTIGVVKFVFNILLCRIDINTLQLSNIINLPIYDTSLDMSSLLHSLTDTILDTKDFKSIDIYEGHKLCVANIDSVITLYKSRYIYSYNDKVYQFKELYKLLAVNGVDLFRFEKIYIVSYGGTICLHVNSEVAKFITKLIVLERC